jgi:ketosteroid isomerase-like protein
MDTLHELFTDDATWHVPGSGELSGTKQGRDAILGFFGELFTRSSGTVAVTLDEVIGGDDHTVAISGNHAERDGKSLDQDSVLIFTVTDGRASKVVQFFEDTAANDEFWS